MAGTSITDPQYYAEVGKFIARYNQAIGELPSLIPTVHIVSMGILVALARSTGLVVDWKWSAIPSDSPDQYLFFNRAYGFLAAAGHALLARVVLDAVNRRPAVADEIAGMSLLLSATPWTRDLASAPEVFVDDDHDVLAYAASSSDRLVVSSPGYPPKPLTLAKLKKGRYESCRRNPVIAECLACQGLMEQRGTGFERIRAAMLDHGLMAHSLWQADGYFKVSLPGPAGDFDRLRTPTDARGFIPPSVEARLNGRQKKIMIRVQTEGSVTSGWCRAEFGVSYNTTYRDLSGLVDLGLLIQVGRGRATRYELNAQEP